MNLDDFHKKFLEENPEWGIAEQISSMLRKCRTEAGFTQHELAKKMHTKQSGIARAEKRSPKFVPTLEFMDRFARACGKKLKLPEII